MDDPIAGHPTKVCGRTRHLAGRLVHQQDLVVGAEDDHGIADPVDDRLEELLLSEQRGARLRDLGDIEQDDAASGCRRPGRTQGLAADHQAQVAPGRGGASQTDLDGRLVPRRQRPREAGEQDRAVRASRLTRHSSGTRPRSTPNSCAAVRFIWVTRPWPVTVA